MNNPNLNAAALVTTSKKVGTDRRTVRVSEENVATMDTPSKTKAGQERPRSAAALQAYIRIKMKSSENQCDDKTGHEANRNKNLSLKDVAALVHDRKGEGLTTTSTFKHEYE